MASTMASVREAELGESAELCATLADAFTTEPVLRFLFPDRWRRDARLRRYFAIELEHYVFPVGRAITTDDFRGAVLELPPGKWEMTVSLSGALAYLRVFNRRLSRATRLEKCFERNHLREPHYYVRYAGVATRFQGQGLGSALLRATLDRCDQEGVPAYLEASTERSAAVYERLGFLHLGELRVPDGPRFWPMRRPPAAA
jgi:GNAT superfamily N-acetyltransferase